MNLKKAKEILGIKGPFTEKELRKKRLELIKYYHPDRYAKDSVEKQEEANRISKEINEAYDILKKHAIKSNDEKNNSFNNETSNVDDIDSLMNAVKKEQHKSKANFENAYNILTSYITKSDNSDLNKEVKITYDKYVTKLTGNKEYDQNLIISFKEELKQVYKNYISKYIQFAPIPKFIIERIKLNYDCDCNEFCSEFHSKYEECINKMNMDIEKNFESIKNKEHYESIKKNINNIIDTLKATLQEYEITKKQYEKLLEIYNNKIQLLYDEYERKYYRLILPILLTSNNPNNYETQKNLTKIKKTVFEISEEDAMIAYYQMTSKLDPKLKNTKNIRNKIEERYKMRCFDNIEEKSKAHKLYIKIINLLSNNDCPFEIILMLNNIDFINLELEEKLLTKYEKIFMKEPQLEQTIFFERKNPIKIHIVEKQPAVSDNTLFYRFKMNINTIVSYLQSKFNKKYITIDEFASGYRFIGKQLDYDYGSLYLLYYDDESKKILCLNEEQKFELIDDWILKEYNSYDNKFLNIYKDKEYLKYKILESHLEEELTNDRSSKR